MYMGVCVVVCVSVCVCMCVCVYVCVCVCVLYCGFRGLLQCLSGHAFMAVCCCSVCSIYMLIHMYMYIGVCVVVYVSGCVCVCVCVCCSVWVCWTAYSGMRLWQCVAYTCIHIHRFV